MPRRDIAVRRVGRPQTAGDIGVPTRPGGRRRVAASAAVNRVVGIGSGPANGGRRSKPLPSKPLPSKPLPKKLLPKKPLPKKPLPKKPPRWSAGVSARVSAQPKFRIHLLVPVRAATSCSFPRGARLGNDSVRAYAVRLYGASCTRKARWGRRRKGGPRSRRRIPPWRRSRSITLLSIEILPSVGHTNRGSWARRRPARRRRGLRT